MDDGKYSDRRRSDHVTAGCARIIADPVSFRRVLATLRLTPKVLRLVWQITPRHIIFLFILRVSSPLVPIVQLWLGKILIDGIVATVAGSPSAPSVPFIFGIVSAHQLLALCSNAILQVQTYTQNYVGRRLSMYSDFLLRDKMLHLDLAKIENPLFHDQYNRASMGAGFRPTVLISEVMSIVENTITLVSLGAVFFVFKWPITAFLVVTTVPNVYVLLKYSQKNYDVRRARTSQNRWAIYHASLPTQPQSFKEIKLFQIGPRLLDNYKLFKWREFQEDRMLLRKRQTAGFLSSTVATAAYFAAYAYVVYEALKGNITVGDMAFYSGGFSRCQGAIKSLISVIPNTHDINVYLKDFFDLQKAEPELVKTSGSRPVSRPVRTIEFRHVWFRYPRTERWVLKDVNLTFRQGEKIGLVGENGAGKTTFVKLLCRLYDPTEGAIYINGVDLRELDTEEWHRSIGAIFQDFVNYMGRVRDSIGYGQVDQLDNLPRIVEAAKKGLADDFIRDLPEGYETILGREFSGGVQLSGGQMQRVALSRLFMRDADVLILDEPTFALDPRSEYDIYSTFESRCDGRIGLLISHRFTTMRVADRIIVLNGRVLEDGTHEELIRRGGMYAELFDTQMRALRTSPNNRTCSVSV